MKLLLTAALTLAASAAMAGKSTTQYLFKPGANAQALELGYVMGNDPVANDPSGTTTTKTADLTIDYSYGLSDAMAFGVSTLTGSKKVDNGTTTSTASGLGDLVGYLKGHSDFIHWNVNLGLALSKIKANSTGEVTNRATGGMSIGGGVDALFSSSGWNYGAGLNYHMNMEKSYEVEGGGGGKFTGGNLMKIAGFGEYNYGQGFLGGELSINQAGDVTQKPDSGGETKVKGESTTGLKFFGTYDFNDMATGLFAYEMIMHPAVSDNATKAYNESNITIGARFNF